MKKQTILVIFVLKFTLNLMAQNLISKQVAYHCKRGWQNCEKCIEAYQYKYALLLLNPSNNPEAARPMIKTPNGWATYDIKQWFNSLQEAEQYSKSKNIPLEIAPEDQYSSLQKLSEKLPQKWFLSLNAEKNELTIYSPQTIYTYFENKMNAPVFPQQDKAQKAKEIGKKGYPAITYTLKKSLTPSEKKEIEQKNAQLSLQIQELPKKYKIEHLKPEYVHGKNVYPNYPNASPEEKKRIEDYQKELEKLEAQYIPMPMYSHSEFDLWNEVIIGAETATESVYPESVSQEVVQVLRLVRNFFSQK